MPRLRRFVRMLSLCLLCCFIAWTTINLICAPHLVTERPPRPPPLKSMERIFIASIQWKSEAVLNSHWNAALFNLAQELGPDRVFVSIVESGSWDSTPAALTKLSQRLDTAGIPNHIVLDKTTHQHAISQSPADEGWVWTPRERWELRRIPFLASYRNRALEPLYQRLSTNGQYFDKILFLNDVVFTTDDVRTLLSTRNGSFAAACALDFSRSSEFYDTFAFRDIHGHGALMQTYPYFRAVDSREALQANKPVPMRSCWNGMSKSPKIHCFLYYD